MLFFQKTVFRLQPLTCIRNSFPYATKRGLLTFSASDSYTENIPFEKHMGINPFVFPRWQCAMQKLNFLNNIPWGGSICESAQKVADKVFKTPRSMGLMGKGPLNHISQSHKGLDLLLLHSLLVETVMPLIPIQKKKTKNKQHTQNMLMLHKTGSVLGTTNFVTKQGGACFWPILFVLYHCRVWSFQKAIAFYILLPLKASPTKMSILWRGRNYALSLKPSLCDVLQERCILTENKAIIISPWLFPFSSNHSNSSSWY